MITLFISYWTLYVFAYISCFVCIILFILYKLSYLSCVQFVLINLWHCPKPAPWCLSWAVPVQMLSISWWDHVIDCHRSGILHDSRQMRSSSSWMSREQMVAPKIELDLSEWDDSGILPWYLACIQKLAGSQLAGSQFSLLHDIKNKRITKRKLKIVQ